MFATKENGVCKAMSHSNTVQLTKNEVGISRHVPITHLNNPAIFETQSGMLGMVLRIDGVTFDAEGDDVLNHYKFLEHRAVSMLDDRFAIYVTVHRHKENMQLNGDFDNDFARELDLRYHAQFRNSNLYINDIYMTLIFKGMSSGKMGKSIGIFNRLKNKAIKDARELSRIAQIKELKKTVDQTKAILSVFNPRILGENDKEATHSEVLSFLSLLVNGGKSLTLPYADTTPVIGKNMTEAKKLGALYPFGKISQYLSDKRLFFGEYIQFQGATKNDVIYGVIISIKNYGNQGASIMFDTLLHLDSDFINTHSYAVEAKNIAQNFIKKHIRRMHNVNDPAISQIEALSAAQDMLASDEITMGYHHNTILLLSSNLNELDKKIAQCIKCYSDAGFVAVRETMGQEPAFWAQIPSNFKYIARSSLITSENFVDFASLHNYRTGFCDANHLRSAVTILETPSKTPYRFNFHAKGNLDNPSKGHAIIIGGNNSGKTVLMTFMDAQLTRYHNNTFYFDRDRGAEIYIRAIKGTYSVLSPNHPKNTQFAPLQLKDTPRNRQFNRDLLISFCKQDEHDELNADVIEALTQCVNYAYDHLAPEFRNFSNATKILPIHFSKWASLRRWLRSGGKHQSGEYAYIFDNISDQLSLQKKMGFDMTHFLDNEPAHIRTALMMYLFHRIDLVIKAESDDDITTSKQALTTVWLDEGWQYLQDDYWIKALSKALPTWRKRNAHIVIATQSLSSVSQSKLKHVIMDNVATQIYFSNPQASEEDYINGLNLSHAEFQIIKRNSPESRLFLIKQEHESVLCKLNLNYLENDLAILSGNSKTVALLDSIRSEAGDDPKDWMPIFLQSRLSERV